MAGREHETKVVYDDTHQGIESYQHQCLTCGHTGPKHYNDGDEPARYVRQPFDPEEYYNWDSRARDHAEADSSEHRATEYWRKRS